LPPHTQFQRHPALHSIASSHTMPRGARPQQPWEGTMAGRKLAASLIVTLVALFVGAACSSDSQTIAFTSDRNGTSGIYLASPGSESVSSLTAPGLTAFSPRWSPDGRQVAFLASNDGVVDIFVQEVGVTEATRVTDTPQEEKRLRWSPDGKTLAFLVDVPGVSQHLHVMDDLKSGQSRRLTAGAASESDHAWSEDGKRLAFAVLEGGNPSPGLFLRNPSGVNEVRLTLGLDAAPAWGPNDGAVVFQSMRDENDEIYRLDLRNDAPDGEPVRLTDNPASDHSPAWSPDGKWVAFISDRDGNQEVYVMTPDGTELTRLSFNTAEEQDLAWSADNRLAFVSDVNGSDDVFIMDPNGMNQERITLSMAQDWEPHW